MTIAAIDIGTNTVLLLVARVDAAGHITPLVYEQRVPRLGKGVDAQKNLQPESMQRVLRVLREYKAVIANYDIQAVVVAGTSAVRDAKNREELATLIKDETGFDLEVLGGQDEALWTYRGAISGAPGIHRATVLDIGGGSTEITTGDLQAIVCKASLNIGSVRLTERCFKNDPPRREDLDAAIEIVRDELTKIGDLDCAGSTLVGVAGTATSLAILAQGLREFRIEAVTNYKLTFQAVDRLFKTLLQMPSETIKGLSSVMEGRHDVITAGTLILHQLMRHYAFDEMVVSERGVRYGLVIREWEKREGVME